MGSPADDRVSQLIEQGERALRARNPSAALPLLRQAEALSPADPNLKMQLALALRATGDLQGALDMLDQALVIDPYLLLALLSKGWLLERLGRPRDAAAIYRNALKIAPPDDQLAPSLLEPVQRAREAVREDTARTEAFLLERTRQLREGNAGEAMDRFDLGLQIFAGGKKLYTPQPALLHYPGLPISQFYDRGLFPWLGELEAATQSIRDELVLVLREDAEAFNPYIQYPPGVPVNQWVELNHNPRWNSYFLWKDGQKDEAHCRRCPLTAGLLGRIPMLDQPGFGPTAVFSVLAPKTHIPPHTGSTNTRLLVHLPLILPGPARFRVGNEVREWKMGEAWVFDDTIEHEAWNDADQTRVILIIDVWNPHLTAAERELISAMMTAKAEYSADGPPP